MAFYLVNGLVSGLILAAFLALCDGLFQTNTLQVLIDVSYIPPLSQLPPILELALHIVVSIVVTVMLVVFYPRLPGKPLFRYLLFWVGLFCFIYFPICMLLTQPLSLKEFLIWAVGHIIYTAFLVFQVEKYR